MLVYASDKYGSWYRVVQVQSYNDKEWEGEELILKIQHLHRLGSETKSIVDRINSFSKDNIKSFEHTKLEFNFQLTIFFTCGQKKSIYELSIIRKNSKLVCKKSLKLGTRY